MERIIFLDIDGVMNSDEYFTNNPNRKGDSMFIDPEKVKLLNRLNDIHGISIVISSSWRRSADVPLKNLGLDIQISGHTEHYSNDWICRGNEIEKYLIERFGGIGTKFGETGSSKYRYVILDDDTDMLLGQMYNFIKIDRESGLTESDIDLARRILLG